MKKVRWILNGLSLAVICGGAYALTPSEASAQGGGTCCNQTGATCYIDFGSKVVVQENSYYSSGACG